MLLDGPVVFCAFHVYNYQGAALSRLVTDWLFAPAVIEDTVVIIGSIDLPSTVRNEYLESIHFCNNATHSHHAVIVSKAGQNSN